MGEKELLSESEYYISILNSDRLLDAELSFQSTGKLRIKQFNDLSDVVQLNVNSSV